jgi:hypothetical protein
MVSYLLTITDQVAYYSIFEISEFLTMVIVHYLSGKKVGYTILIHILKLVKLIDNLLIANV